VIGGTSLMGGRGGIGLTLIGALTIGYLEKILSINAVGEASRLMLTGVIIVAAVLFQKVRQKNKKGQTMKTISKSAATLLVILLAFGGCKKQETTLTIGMSQCNLGEPWRVQMNADIKNAAQKHPEINVIYKDAQNDSLTQKAQIEEFISSGVNLLIVSPKEAAPLTPPISEAYKKGIPVIVLDRRVLGSDYTCFIGGDNKAIGKAVGQYIVKRLGGKGKIVELQGLMTSVPAQDRHSGFMEGIKGSGIDIIFSADMKWLEPDARKEMESALARFDKIDLVYAHNDPGAHGAYLAAKASGREKGIVFVGVDALPQEGQIYVKQGILSASFEYPTGGDRAIETALEILKGKKVDKEIILPTKAYLAPSN
jgi:ribose transport system substrate-binding protein